MQQNTLLWVLAISAEHKRPLGPMLSALAQDEQDFSWNRRLELLSQHLLEGLPLPDALERVPGLLPGDVVLAIRVGTETGTLSAMLKETAKAFAERQQTDDSVLQGTLLYLFALLTALTSVASFLMYYIIPKFKKIFEDFGTELPGLTQWVIWVSDEFVKWGMFLYFPLLVLLGFYSWRVKQGYSNNALGWLVVPSGRLNAPWFLNILASVVEQGRPLVGAISTLARHASGSRFRSQLLEIRNDLEHGGELWDLLKETGVLTGSERRILDASERAGNLGWALRETANNIEKEVEYRTLLCLEMLRPTVLISVSVAVGIFSVSMFLPLIKLINDLS